MWMCEARSQVYMHEGVKKSLFHHNISIPKLVKRMIVDDDEGELKMWTKLSISKEAAFVIFDNYSKKLKRETLDDHQNVSPNLTMCHTLPYSQMHTHTLTHRHTRRSSNTHTHANSYIGTSLCF